MIRDIMPAAVACDVYTEAVIHAAGALPWLVPLVAEYLDTNTLHIIHTSCRIIHLKKHEVPLHFPIASRLIFL